LVGIRPGSGTGNPGAERQLATRSKAQ